MKTFLLRNTSHRYKYTNMLIIATSNFYWWRKTSYHCLGRTTGGPQLDELLTKSPLLWPGFELMRWEDKETEKAQISDSTHPLGRPYHRRNLYLLSFMSNGLLYLLPYLTVMQSTYLINKQCKYLSINISDIRIFVNKKTYFRQ